MCTDGSAAGGSKNGGFAVVITQGHVNISYFVATKKRGKAFIRPFIKEKNDTPSITDMIKKQC